MNTQTLTRPPAVGLMPAGWDPRPCVNKPPQWWDVGNEHNVRAVRYCRNVCPRLAQCAADITDETQPKGQIRAGRAYNEYGKQITICNDCHQPRSRRDSANPITCGCLTRAETRAQTRAQRQAAREAARLAAERARIAADQEKAAKLGGLQLVDVWEPLHHAGLNIREAAEHLGVRHNTLKNALHRARAAGDRRVPHFRAARTKREAA